MMNAPRSPTPEERHQLALAVAADDLTIEDARGQVDAACIAVFDQYMPDGPGYTGRVAVVVWSGGCDLVDAFGFRDGRVFHCTE